MRVRKPPCLQRSSLAAFFADGRWRPQEPSAGLKRSGRGAIAQPSDEHQAALDRIELEDLELGLTRKRVGLFYACVFLGIAAVLLVAAGVWAFAHGGHNTLTIVTIPTSIVSTLLTFLLGQRFRDRSR
jgi:hypothetical protein